MAIWLFDSDCVLCTRGVQYTLKHEKEPTIRFVAITSDEGRALAIQHGLDPDDPTSFLFIDDGQVYDASDAVIALSRHLKGPARALPLLRLLPKALRDAGYRVFARNRYRLFGKVESCITPTPQQRHRFVL
ncbi:MAG: DCC1-like thiol-disulfide oxidoreductase family protein [Pseudomonadota bacterium]